MDDDTLALLSDLDILLSDSGNIPQTTVCEDTGRLGEDYCSISYIYGDFAEVQPLPHPRIPLPVYSKNNNTSSSSTGIEVPCVRKRGRHDKGSAGKVTKVADKENAAEREFEDRPKRKRTAEQHSVYERKRRSRIQEKLRTLQEMVPNASKLTKSSMLDETIKHIKGLQLHLQMMKEHGLGFQSQCILMGKIQKMQSSLQYYYSTCIDPNQMRSPSGVGHGPRTLPSAVLYPPMSPEDGGWPQISGTGVFPYYYDYPTPPETMFPAADGSPLPPVVTAEVLAHVSPSNHHPAVPLILPILRQVSLANQEGDDINYHGPIMPNNSVHQIPRTAQEFSLLINVPEQFGEASASYGGGNSVDHSYNLNGFGQTHPRN